MHLSDRLGADELAEAGHDPNTPNGNLLACVLGVAAELLIWIPKIRGSILRRKQRPLSLPSCLRRLFGAAAMRVLGPAVEPALDPAQAAVAGGSCARNIAKALAHLHDDHPRPATPLPHRPWACRVLFGRLSEAVLELCRRIQGSPDGLLARTVAAFLLDQAKAFEMVSHRWLRRILRAWRFPSWAAAAILALVEGRTIHDPRLGRMRMPGFRRGTGMGGPASTLTWELGFDPVSWVAGMAAMCALLVYVDDLLALVVGPGHAMLLYLSLLAATNEAGLSVEDHSCSAVHVSHGRAVATEALAPFPVVVRAGPFGDDSFTIDTGPVEVYLDILRIAQILPSQHRAVIVRHHCTCQAKHALVPAHHTRLWAAALEHTPLAAACVPGAPFLGVYLCGRERPHEEGVGAYGTSNDALAVAKWLTWKKAIDMCCERVSDMLNSGLSLLNRAASWNTHCVSTLPYAASTFVADLEIVDLLRTALHRLFPTGTWARAGLPADVGSALALKGAPRDPGIVALLASISALRCGRFAGLDSDRRLIDDRWREVLGWAGQWLAQACVAVDPADRCRTAAARIIVRLADCSDPDYHRCLGKGQAVYRALWELQDRGHTMLYLRGRSADRRWGASVGEEWAALALCPSWAEAWLVMRFLLNGLPKGGVGRPAVPHDNSGAGLQACWGCGSQERWQWKWLPAEPGRDGFGGDGDARAIGWCPACCRGRTCGAAPGISSCYSALPGPPCTARACLRPCPLCSTGCAGAEHLAVFCPAVGNAWQALGGGVGTWLPWRLSGVGAAATKLAIRFTHGLAFLSLALHGRTPLCETEGVRRILQQVARRGLPVSARPDLALASGQGTFDVGGVRDLVATWLGPSVLQDPRAALCRACPRHGSSCVANWAERHNAREALAQNSGQTVGLVATRRVRAGEQLFRLRAECTPAVWPAHDAGVWGRPFAGGRRSDNCRWTHARCAACGATVLTVTAVADIPTGGMVIGPPPPLTAELPGHNAPWQVSFDGGRRSASGRHDSPDQVAGAGAALWGPIGRDGSRPCVAQLVLSLPHIGDSMVAEAFGFRGALGLAAAFQCTRDLDVVGDNLPILRMAAACGRLTAADPWRTVEAPLMRAAADAWGTRWYAVRRCFNRHADALATRGVEGSIAAVERGDRRPAAWLWVHPQFRSSLPSNAVEWVDFPLLPLASSAAPV